MNDFQVVCDRQINRVAIADNNLTIDFYVQPVPPLAWVELPVEPGTELYRFFEAMTVEQREAWFRDFYEELESEADGGAES